jgi:Tfp pilus assembly protein PilF
MKTKPRMPICSEGAVRSAGRRIAALLLASRALFGGVYAVADDLGSPVRPSGMGSLARAQSQQHVHDFTTALQEIDRVLARDPRNLQAWLTRAAIHQVQGEYGSAAADCRNLALLAAPLMTIDCLSRAASHQGKAQLAYDQLRAARDRSNAIDPQQRREVEITLADIATRLGQAEAARTHYQSALSSPDVDSYMLVTYAEFLLEQRDYRGVLQLAATYPARSELFLAAAIASREANTADRHRRAELAKQRYEERRLTNSAPTRDDARFLLDIADDAQAALQAAAKNWETQREPADALVLLRAAVAANRADAAEPIRAFIQSNGLEDRRLELLLRRIQNG